VRICIIELIRDGGMVHYASQLANALSAGEDNEIQVIVPERTDVSLFNTRIRMRTVPTIGRHPYRIDILLRHLVRFRPDRVHISIRHPLLLPLLPLLSLMKVPLFLTVHDVTPHEGEGKVIAGISTQVSLYFSRAVFVHGEKLKADLVARGFPDEKIVVIPHGDYSFFTRLDPGVRPMAEKSTLLFFGRILDYKGLEYLIRAVPGLAKNIPELKVIIAGEGDLSKYGKMIGAGDRFEIINRFIPDDEVAALFRRASVVVLPYIEASQTGVIPIAYAFSKPVVTTSVGSIPEIVDDGVTGIIVPPRDSRALGEAVAKLVLDPHLGEQMGAAGRKLMEQRMSWNTVAGKVMEAYQRSGA
jgi:alpha-maltose-1-phosphate synthase